MTDKDEHTNDILDRYTSGVSVSTSGHENSDEKASKTSMSKSSNKNDGSIEKKTNLSQKRDDWAKDSEDVVRDRKGVLMYLPEDIRKELNIRFDELNAKHKRQHGEAIEKNRDYYPAVILAGLTDNDLKDILEL
jgi:seryl-tRNA synthetase